MVSQSNEPTRGVLRDISTKIPVGEVSRASSSMKASIDLSKLSVRCLSCKNERRDIMITACHHIYCKSCMMRITINNLPCKSCGAAILEFADYQAFELVGADGKAKDARVLKALMLIQSAVETKSGLNSHDEASPNTGRLSPVTLTRSDKILTTTANNGVDALNNVGEGGPPVDHLKRKQPDGDLSHVEFPDEGLRLKLRKAISGAHARVENASRVVPEPTEEALATADHDPDLQNAITEGLKRKAKEHEAESRRVNKRLLILEKSLAMHAAHPKSEPVPLYMRPHSETLGDRVRQLHHYTENDNMKVLAALQGGAVHLHAEAQVQYAEKLESLHAKFKKEVGKLWKELSKVDRHADSTTSSKQTSKDTEPRDGVLVGLKTKLETIESQMTKSPINFFAEITSVKKSHDAIDLRVRELTKENEGLRQENARLSSATTAIEADLAQHTTLLTSIVGVLSLIGEKRG